MTKPAITPQVLQPLRVGDRQLPAILEGHLSDDVERRVQAFYASMPNIYETWLNRRSNAHTRKAYANDMKTFATFMGWELPKDVTLFLTVGVRTVLAYRDHLVEHFAPTTVTRRMASLSNWYRYLSDVVVEMRLPISVPDPASRNFIPRGKPQAQHSARAVPSELVRQLLDAPQGDDVLALRDRALLAVMFYSAARISAIAALEVQDFYITDHGAVLRLQEKGGKIRQIGLHRDAALALRRYIDAAELADGPLFRPVRAPRSRELADRDMDVRSIRYLLDRYYADLPGGEAFSPHSARATAATKALATGVPLTDVQELLGHSSPTTTRVYLQVVKQANEGASHRLAY